MCERILYAIDWLCAGVLIENESQWKNQNKRGAALYCKKKKSQKKEKLFKKAANPVKRRFLCIVYAIELV